MIFISEKTPHPQYQPQHDIKARRCPAGAHFGSKDIESCPVDSQSAFMLPILLCPYKTKYLDLEKREGGCFLENNFYDNISFSTI